MKDILARALVFLRKHKEYRFGQALWNCLPVERQEEWAGTKYDFYYEVDEKKVLDTFMEACEHESSATSEEER